jgi:hypothetical protein
MVERSPPRASTPWRVWYRWEASGVQWVDPDCGCVGRLRAMFGRSSDDSTREAVPRRPLDFGVKVESFARTDGLPAEVDLDAPCVKSESQLGDRSVPRY